MSKSVSASVGQTAPPASEIVVTLRLQDALALVMGPLAYTVASRAGDVPAGGRPLLARQEMAKAIAVARPDLATWEDR